MFYEGSFKLWGSQTQLIIEKNNEINPLVMMINYSLTGIASGWDLLKYDNPRFENYCCTLLFPLLPGIIGHVEGIKDINDIPDVINITQLYNIGDQILLTGSLHHLFLRVYICSKTKDRLAFVIDYIDKKLKIKSLNGENMRMKSFDPEIVLQNY